MMWLLLAAVAGALTPNMSPSAASSPPTADQLPGATILSPAAIAADQNDYNAGTITASTVIRVDPDAHVALTGLAGGSAGYHAQVCNIDTVFRVRLADQSASSTAANRIDTQDAAGLFVQPGACADLVYDGTSSRWRAPVSSPEIALILANDFVESLNTITDVTGMACSTVSGATYLVSVVGDFDTAATTTGLQWGIVSTGSAGSFWAVTPSAGTATVNRLESITAGTLAAGTGTAATTGNPFWGTAVVTTTTGADIRLRARSEIASSAITLRAGRTIMTCRRIA